MAGDYLLIYGHIEITYNLCLIFIVQSSILYHQAPELAKGLFKSVKKLREKQVNDGLTNVNDVATNVIINPLNKNKESNHTTLSIVACDHDQELNRIEASVNTNFDMDPNPAITKTDTSLILCNGAKTKVK